MSILDLNPVERARIEEILAAFEPRNEDGTYQFSDAEVRHVLPALALLSGWTPAELKDETPLGRLMRQFAAKVSLGKSDPLPVWERQVADYYRFSPPNPALLARLKAQLEQTPAP